MSSRRGGRHLTRRDFVSRSTACAAHVALMGTALPRSARAWSTRTRGRVVAQEAFARVEQVGQGLWAIVSTPLSGDFTTVSNGGIVAGTNGVLLFEALASEDGARWMRERCLELTGRPPTHVVISHHHGDHVAGLAGLATEAGAPALRITAPARDRARAAADAADAAQARRARLLDGAELLPTDRPTTIDLGARTVRLVPRRGHTPSDVTAELEDDGIVWCGDLVWNGMFPNYVDATPSELGAAVRDLAASDGRLYVPGHGPLADPDDLRLYRTVLDHVEAAARDAAARGWDAAEAAARFALPGAAEEWTLFNDAYFQRALGAWLRELAGA